MLHKAKNFIRNSIPARYQVPLKYWYGRLRGDVEEEMDLLAFLVRPGMPAIDVGGNRGIYAYRLAGLGARLEVFEPNPDCIRVLEHWAAGKPNVRIHAVALSTRSGTADLHIPVDARGVEHDASASIEAHKVEGVRDLSVPLRRLDDFGFSGVGFIKIDVEGHESSVLEGASETLAGSKPALLIEIEQRHNVRPIQRIFDSLAALGYRGFFLLDGKLESIDRFDPGRHQSLETFAAHGKGYHNNFLFLHSDRIAAGDYRALMQRLAGR